jgi:hypothetical protein
MRHVDFKYVFKQRDMYRTTPARDTGVHFSYFVCHITVSFPQHGIVLWISATRLCLNGFDSSPPNSPFQGQSNMLLESRVLFVCALLGLVFARPSHPLFMVATGVCVCFFAYFCSIGLRSFRLK